MEENIKLANITVYYNQTTVQELINKGYSFTMKEVEYHQDSKTLMCGFYKDNMYYGELVFYDIPHHFTRKDILKYKIQLILLEEKPKQKYTKVLKEDMSFLGFMEFKGKQGKNDIKLLLVFYSIVLLLGFIFGDSIPQELKIVTLILPFAFFGLAFVFWVVKLIFWKVFQSFSKKTAFGILFLSIFLWFLIFANIIDYLRNQNTDSWILVIVMALGVLAVPTFGIYQGMKFLFHKVISMKKKEMIMYVIIPHGLLYSLVYLYIAYFRESTLYPQNQTLLLLYEISVLIYCMFSLRAFLNCILALTLFKKKPIK
ncbi:membrane protease YdiL (CAAX protease family) [Breznakia sp. PF5-3]|uniref:hypothetical protein n=1 Tax=unclassified Breznakia TaxID=2623764 RepID=UPI002405FD44|nr:MULTISPECIES: hypothetical protein [unclassified Breznakia]MDL2276423.1 hypothetical protein [Breznakia sp. OttesenSCG-928-G09]MDF9823809.1 membrane protease YdiL (CAAX protease family) [Breznakia sp. PM6-1]MDF9834625.1 membrane protease YdiL (CAAX protease family) [Breznakia sp. PF5-3]MDF9836758.1 membrane protease YdiL (CAAX protease family) [Breznakia sp. PFB2-8]MDF9858793.1 membrane protease YdiL (CAAX protease family) [Breznakia sp. PH5-24]